MRIERYVVTLFWTMLAVSLAAGPAPAQMAAPEEIMEKSHLAYYYAGDDMVVEVRMVLVDKNGNERAREFTMLRKDIEEGGRQRYYTYFRKPSDVARLSFMVHKTPDGNDMRWIYVPAIDLVKPISADDKNSSFVGSDFTYEEVSGRHWSEDTHTLAGESVIDGKPVYIVESVPKGSTKGFAKRVSFIDKESFLPLKEEYYDKSGTMTRIFKAEKIDPADGILTVMRRTMEDLKKGSKTIVEFSAVAYNKGLTEDIFTERYLKNPPREYVK